VESQETSLHPGLFLRTLRVDGERNTGWCHSGPGSRRGGTVGELPEPRCLEASP